VITDGIRSASVGPEERHRVANAEAMRDAREQCRVGQEARASTAAHRLAQMSTSAMCWLAVSNL
jgi:hypothetical protein